MRELKPARADVFSGFSVTCCISDLLQGLLAERMGLVSEFTTHLPKTNINYFVGGYMWVNIIGYKVLCLMFE